MLTKQTEATGGEADIDAGKKSCNACNSFKLDLYVDLGIDLDLDIDFGAGKEALLVYQDDSSDEMEDVMNDLLVPASDTDDDFDEDDGDEAMEVFIP